MHFPFIKQNYQNVGSQLPGYISFRCRVIWTSHSECCGSQCSHHFIFSKRIKNIKTHCWLSAQHQTADGWFPPTIMNMHFRLFHFLWHRPWNWRWSSVAAQCLVTVPTTPNANKFGCCNCLWIDFCKYLLILYLMAVKDIKEIIKLDTTDISALELEHCYAVNGCTQFVANDWILSIYVSYSILSFWN